MNEQNKTIPDFVPTGPASAMLPMRDQSGKPITVIATEAIRRGFDEICLTQALNSRAAPGVTDLVLNPDAHCGYGAPVGSVLVSPSHIYPGPVGVDIKCSMSLLQLDVPEEAIASREVRRALIDAICERTPTGPGQGQRSVKRSRRVPTDTIMRGMFEGATPAICAAMGIPSQWAERCEDAQHVGHQGTAEGLGERFESLLGRKLISNPQDKLAQLGSYGGGNHFGECEVVRLADDARLRAIGERFGLRDGHVGFLSHCGSRGIGFQLANQQFRSLQQKFADWDIPLPGGDRELVYAPLGSPEANDYLDDMALGANFATLNHLLINALVLEAFQQVLPGATGQLIYFISHNIARREIVDNRPAWVHRKGATRAFPAKHHALLETPFYETGHPILLPGNPCSGSVVMVAEPGAAMSCFSVNHGAGRRMGRREAIRRLDQTTIDEQFARADILSNCRQYPKDEAPAAYKDFREVLASVEQAGLASIVARLEARFVIKDADKSLGGAA